MDRTQSEPDLSALARRATAGEQSAAQSLVSRLRPLVVRYCRARLGPGTEGTYRVAEDVAQEVCLGVMTALPHYRDVGRPFTAFVFGIAAHKVAEVHRAVAHDHHDMLDASEVHLGGAARALLERLPPPQRDVLVMRIAVGFTAEETGAALGMSLGAVRVAQHRALSGALATEVAAGGVGVAGPLELAAVQRDDQLLDSLSQRCDMADRTDALTALLAGWRDDVCDGQGPSAAQKEVSAGGSLGRRTGRPVLIGLVLVGVLLSASGVAAAASRATPGSVLWPVTEVVAPRHAQSILARDRVMRTLAAAKRQAKRGDAAAARASLDDAMSRVDDVQAADGKSTLQAEVAKLRAALYSPVPDPLASPGPSASPLASPADVPSSSPGPAPSVSPSPGPTPSPDPSPQKSPVGRPSPGHGRP